MSCSVYQSFNHLLSIRRDWAKSGAVGELSCLFIRVGVLWLCLVSFFLVKWWIVSAATAAAHLSPLTVYNVHTTATEQQQQQHLFIFCIFHPSPQQQTNKSRRSVGLATDQTISLHIFFFFFLAKFSILLSKEDSRVELNFVEALLALCEIMSSVVPLMISSDDGFV